MDVTLLSLAETFLEEGEERKVWEQALPTVDRQYGKRAVAFHYAHALDWQKAWCVMGHVYCGGVSKSIEPDWSGVITI